MKRENSIETREKILSLIDSEFDSDASFEREMGLASKTVNNWRRGRSSSYMKMLPTLADAFGVSVGELLDMPLGKDAAELSDDEISLLSLYRKCTYLSPKQRIALQNTLENVINLYLGSMADPRTNKKK